MCRSLNRVGGDPEIREKIESVGKAFGFTVMNEETNLGLGKALGTYFSLLYSRVSAFRSGASPLTYPALGGSQPT